MRIDEYMRDPRFLEMFEDLEDQEDKDALSSVGRYLAVEHGYTFSELQQALGQDIEGLIADALTAGDGFKKLIDDSLIDPFQKKRRSASLIAEQYQDLPEAT